MIINIESNEGDENDERSNASIVKSIPFQPQADFNLSVKIYFPHRWSAISLHTDHIFLQGNVFSVRLVTVTRLTS